MQYIFLRLLLDLLPGAEHSTLFVFHNAKDRHRQSRETSFQILSHSLNHRDKLLLGGFPLLDQVRSQSYLLLYDSGFKTTFSGGQYLHFSLHCLSPPLRSGASWLYNEKVLSAGSRRLLGRTEAHQGEIIGLEANGFDLALLQ